MTKLTRAQRWADTVTEFSGSWMFINTFTIAGIAWVTVNSMGWARWDVYPFLFLNMALTVVSTMQSPLILMSQNRQNETDRENMRLLNEKIDALLARQE